VLIDNLHTIILWTTTVVLLIASLLIVFSLVRLQRQSARGEQTVGNSNSALDLLWTLIPIGILALLLLLTYQAVTATDTSLPPTLSIPAGE
jgi:heme/copper-type cytochrome/quinol oxidase subunit 2